MVEGFHLQIDAPIARLQIDRSLRKNAITQAMWEALPNLLKKLETNTQIKVVILEARSPGIFSAGADITEFRDIAKDEQRRLDNALAIRNAVRALKLFPKPIIAKIEGDCVGGGCSLILACDLRFTTAGARFGITPARLGLVYNLMDTKALVDLVGPAQAKYLLFTAQLIEAEEARRIGLVNDVLAGDKIDAHVLGVAKQMSRVSQHSVRGIKSILQRISDGQADDDADTKALFQDCYDGPDYAEGVDAFLEKRAPEFPVK